MLCLSLFLCFSSCNGKDRNFQSATNFQAERYLGKWYEIARFDFRFERNLNNTTATYSLNENGTIKVVNEGYNYVKNKWSKAVGKAKFAADKNTASLKVSFFGPFYSPYQVIALDEDYQYALVAGGSTSYLWILSRQKTIPENIKTQYLKIAKDLGFDITKLIWVEHNK